ncbi:GNAT family N-acetyltransferase [Alicyclobacillus sp. SO9]|uniref:GNAT family N-acetyltransferase n=1 Tax=Alicyclobacillus sp. SO9 TaxID=2665646 RepID=UPI0018E75551|nr:GNAT family N-acetyltransferase [Alicyclobacillus sp. SO9]QQE77086.1 GNAT family N-acetyltransferase [Alicyclobacillus sp. SO9]
MEQVRYEFVTDLNAAEVADVFRNAGIRRPVDDTQRIQSMIDNSNLIVTARLNGRLVGIARGLTDFAWCCYLSDLAVDKQFQRMGIGKELMRQVREEIGPGVKLLLVAAETAEEYYPKIGFEKVDRAYGIPRMY